jgi:starch-binding outer membrane protein, SusD/RagB family
MKKYFLKINILFAALALGFILSSCEDQLESKIYTDLTQDNFFKTEADFFAALTGLYSPFTAHWGDTDPGDGVWYPALYNANNRTYLLRSMLTTDELYNDWDMNLQNFTWGPSTWTGAGEGNYVKIRYVARATDVIDNISKSDVNELIKNQYIAEAKVLRAWLMYELYDFFGPVNVKLDPASLSGTEILPRPTAAAYCAQIESDLNDALATDEFPESYNSDATNWGRVSKGVARMLKLKLYMHNKQWTEAELVGKEIMAMGYGLETNYADIFTSKANNELIYAIPCNATTPNWWPQHMFPAGYSFGYAGSVKIQRGAGWYGYSMPWAFFNKFEATDLRKNTIIYEYYKITGAKKDTTLVDSSSGLRGAIPLKYTSITGDGPDYPIDVVVFRYAEVLLSVAEAINEQRGPADAYEYVNLVRERAGVSDWSGLTKEQFRVAILDERGRELFAEGARRQDLIRHGKFIEYAQARGITDAEDHEVLFPIPQEVITESNGAVVQNDGY